ncbi:hypothetical protein WUMEUNZI_CDS0146 [Salmonella phage SeKF_63]|uniref:Uncharacterized protein n=1 Tax=Enterobacteria phage KhF1 TaxID=1651203 RepID=A0A384T9B3_9CAUD|nr:hypothetical protein [Enterobacteria phage KhF1]ANZ51950.1 hypothetical protein [Enterobacteria phage KhF2]
MKTVDATFEVVKEKFSIIYEAVNCYEASHNLDNWKFTDDHQGGVTVKNPNCQRNEFKYAIPLHYSLKQLSSDYAKQGRENPSKEAYTSLQKELERDLEASEYNLAAKVVDANGQTILDSFYIGYAFDWCYSDGDDLDDRLKEEVNNSDAESEVLERLESLKDSVMNIFKN